MNIFKVEEGEVILDVEWIQMVAQFDALFDGNKSRRTKYGKKSLGRKLLAYVYFMEDFSSPIHDFDEEERHKEALLYTELEHKHVANDEHVKEARKVYESIQLKSCRTLKTYKAALKGMTAMDAYLETINFKDVDKQGKLKYTPNQFITTIQNTNKAHDELEKLRKRTEADMKKNSGVRGNAILSDLEKESKMTKKSEEWDEGGSAPITAAKDVTMTELGELLQTQSEEEEGDVS
mgnify:CR=1 FL=1